MTASEGTEQPRRGTPGDLVQRMERIEGRQDDQAVKMDDQARQIASLSTAVSRVEQTLIHTAEMNAIHFGALKDGITTITSKFEAFSGGINDLITGRVRLPQAEEQMADYKRWRSEVDEDREAQAIRNGRLDLIGKVIWGLVVANVSLIAGFVVVVVKVLNP